MRATRRPFPAGPFAFLIAAVAFGAAVVPRAFAVVDTIEAGVADADAVVIATLATLYHDPPGHPDPRGHATLQVVEVVKGQASAELPLIVPTFHAHAFANCKREGGRRLVPLVRVERALWHPRDTRHPLALRTHAWTVSEAAYRAVPPAGGPVVTAIAFTTDLRPLLTQDEVFAAAREAAAWPGPPGRGYAVLNVPEGKVRILAIPVRDQMRLLHLPQVRQLRIPLDERAERVAHRWAADPALAAQVATVLAAFPSDQNAAILRRLLDDPQTVVEGRPGKGMTWRHPVRDLAARTLENWGRLERPARVRGPRDFYTPMGVRHLVAATVVTVAFAAGVLIVRRRGWRVPVVGVLCAPALALVGWHMAVATRTVHEVTASFGGSRYWVSAYRDGVQFVRIRGWPQRQPLSFAAPDLAHAPEPLWNEQDVFVTDQARLAGFRRITGTMWGPEPRGATYPYGSFTVPTAILAAGLALWPAWVTFAFVRARARRRARINRGCCAACGYDLRGAGDHCPECGAPRPPRPWAMPAP